MVYLDAMDSKTGLIDPAQSRDKGKELAEAYGAAAPFPNVVIDNFLPPAIPEMVIADLAAVRDKLDVEQFDRAQERYKSNFNPESLPESIRNLFYSFNSRPFIRVLENITGIKGLIPDPFFIGAGIHEIRQGGHLSIHADFNHHRLMNLERRINVLIYLNEDWSPEYGGQLELWNTGMTKMEHSIVPLLNRCVIFNTTSDSQHGNPNPVSHPESIPRKSIALYYYTATWDASKRSHTTQFQVRPKSNDKRDWSIKLLEIANEFVPPVMMRGYWVLRNKITKN